jgi:hypothetical protein
VEQRDSFTFEAVIVEFRLEIGGSHEWRDVQASITYLGEDENEVQHAGRVNWVGSQKLWVQFYLLETQKLIIALEAQDGWRTVEGVESQLLKDGVRYAQIVLHDDAGLHLPPFVLDLDTEEIKQQ